MGDVSVHVLASTLLLYLSTSSLVFPDLCSAAASSKSKVVRIYIYVNLHDLLYSGFVLQDQKILACTTNCCDLLRAAFFF